ncbi:MAG: 3-isopropylmalate dehydrogenase [Candidatus Walczuchella monophlebidarum]
MKKNIAILSGDGIGPEIMRQSIKVLNAIAKKFNHNFVYQEALIGAIAIQKTGDPLPKETLEICMESDAVLLGTVGNTNYDSDHKIRPEQGLLKIRKVLDLYCNIRPITTYDLLMNSSPLKMEYIKGTDFIIYRELISGIYFGQKGRSVDGKQAYDYCCYSYDEIERIGRDAFKAALLRKKKLTLVDKANVLETSRLWREIIKKISIDYPEVIVDFLLVDNASMQIILNSSRFDIILTENLFGDILSDESSVITGSIGLLPSASIGRKNALFEPVHGSYPQAEGKNIANPLGCVLSAAMMLDYLELSNEAQEIRKSVENSIHNKKSTVDICKHKSLGTEEVGDFLSQYILNR